MRTMRAVLIAIVGAAVSVAAAADMNDWPSHDHDAGGTPLRQITPANVSRLRQAWSFDTGAPGIQVTPLVVNGIMYVSAGKDVIALEPETARVIWRYTAPGAVSRRGVTCWPGDRNSPPRVL